MHIHSSIIVAILALVPVGNYDLINRLYFGIIAHGRPINNVRCLRHRFAVIANAVILFPLIIATFIFDFQVHWYAMDSDVRSKIAGIAFIGFAAGTIFIITVIAEFILLLVCQSIKPGRDTPLLIDFQVIVGTLSMGIISLIQLILEESMFIFISF